MARWNIEACLEIVRRCEDLYLLIDKKIERTRQVIQRLETASVSAVEAVERLAVLRGMLGKKVEKLTKAKQERQKAEALAREQREHRIMNSMRSGGRRGGFESPTPSGFRGRKQSVMSPQKSEESEVRVRSVTSKPAGVGVGVGWTVEKRARGPFMRSDSGASSGALFEEDMSPSQTVEPASPEEGVSRGEVGNGKSGDVSRELVKGAKGKSRNDWQEETVDDDELRLGD